MFYDLYVYLMILDIIDFYYLFFYFNYCCIFLVIIIMCINILFIEFLV